MFAFIDGKVCIKHAYACALFDLVRNLMDDCLSVNTIKIPFAKANYDEMICAIIRKGNGALAKTDSLSEISNFMQLTVDLFDQNCAVAQWTEKNNRTALRWARKNKCTEPKKMYMEMEYFLTHDIPLWDDLACKCAAGPV